MARVGWPDSCGGMIGARDLLPFSETGRLVLLLNGLLDLYTYFYFSHLLREVKKISPR
jgi:hypothetical protein